MSKLDFLDLLSYLLQRLGLRCSFCRKMPKAETTIERILTRDKYMTGNEPSFSEPYWEKVTTCRCTYCRKILSERRLKLMSPVQENLH